MSPLSEVFDEACQYDISCVIYTWSDDEEEADSPDLQNETEKPFTREQNI